MGQLERTRLGVTVTKRVGNAATRNRIKRWSREFFRTNKHKIAGNWDMNIIAKKEAADLTSGQTFSSLHNLFDRLSRSFDS
jgi:ribonuclease P protein component